MLKYLAKLERNSPANQISQDDLKRVLKTLGFAVLATVAAWITKDLIPSLDDSTPVGVAIVGLLTVAAQTIKRIITDYSKEA